MNGIFAVRGFAMVLLLLLCGIVMNGFSFWIGLLLLIGLLALLAASDLATMRLHDEIAFLKAGKQA